MQAADVMTREVISITPDTEVREIVELMLRNRVSAVPVTDATGKVLGMVSEGDLMRRAENRTDRRDSWWLKELFAPSETPDSYIRTHGKRAQDIMTPSPVTIGEDTPLYQIAQVLEEKGIKRVPVVRDGKLVGLVSRANLLQGFSSGATTTPATADDRQIRERIVEEMRQRLDISPSTTNVVVTSGEVDLWGLVDSDAQKRGAQVAAESTAGVSVVRNHLKVSPSTLTST